MRKMYLCLTDFQILNALNLQMHKFNGEEADIFFVTNKEGNEKLADRLKATGIFKNVYLFNISKISGLHQYFRDLTEHRVTVVLITHHMTEAIRAQRVIVMDAGRILADGTPKEVFPQVELLESVGLTVPATTKVLYALNQAGFDLPLDALSTEECAQVLLAAIGAKT